MTPEERVEGILHTYCNNPSRNIYTLSDLIGKALHEAIAEEREACAKIAEEEATRVGMSDPSSDTAASIMVAIRNQKQ